MKMIVTILRDEDTETVINTLARRELPITRIASSGGFMRQGTSTLMVGVEDQNIEAVIRVIRNVCIPAVDPLLKRARLFVLNVEHFEQY
jgi:uncharacterized protein YaaQ